MKNRNIPFGYRFDGGIAVIDQTEKKTLERIEKEKEKAKKEFDLILKNNQGKCYHKIYNYYNN